MIVLMMLSVLRRSWRMCAAQMASTSGETRMKVVEEDVPRERDTMLLYAVRKLSEEMYISRAGREVGTRGGAGREEEVLEGARLLWLKRASVGVKGKLLKRWRVGFGRWEKATEEAEEARGAKKLDAIKFGLHWVLGRTNIFIQGALGTRR